MESIRKWSYLLQNQKFTLVTDQKALSFIFKKDHSSKIKNLKLAMWRLELSSYNYDIVHRPGIDNVAPDAFSRISAVSHDGVNLNELHQHLGHPGVKRLLHFVRSKNLAFSTDDVKKVCAACSHCARIKPRFYKGNPDNKLVKAILPWQS